MQYSSTVITECLSPESLGSQRRFGCQMRPNPPGFRTDLSPEHTADRRARAPRTQPNYNTNTHERGVTHTHTDCKNTAPTSHSLSVRPPISNEKYLHICSSFVDTLHSSERGISPRRLCVCMSHDLPLEGNYAH